MDLHVAHSSRWVVYKNVHLMLHAAFLEYNVPLKLAQLPHSSKAPDFYKINGDLNSRKQFAVLHEN